MTKTLNIGSSSGKPFLLPLDAVTQTFAILARKRVGKTYTGSVMAEEMMKAGQPIVVLDPTGAWSGLRSSADGQKEGYPIVIIGGAHGDLPLEEHSGKIIADMVVDYPGFYIIDFSSMETNAAQDRFATEFASHFYRRKQQKRFPIHLFVDEADSFAPQKPFPGQQKMLGAFEAIVRRGGIFGIGITMITQRSAVLNKNILTQAEVLIALQITHPTDQDVIKDWVSRNGTKEQMTTLMDSLASLTQGEAWIWSPSWLGVFQKINIRKRETFNSSATPKPGETVITPKKLAQVDIDKVKEKLASTLEKAKANDPTELKKTLAEKNKQIVQLEKDLAAKPAAKFDEGMITEKIQDAVLDAEFKVKEYYRKEIEKIHAQVKLYEKKFEEFEKNAPDILTVIEDFLSIDEDRFEYPKPKNTTSKLTLEKKTVQKIDNKPISVAKPVSINHSQSDTNLQPVHLKVLGALSNLEALGIPDVPRIQVAIFSGYSNLFSTGFVKAIGYLRTAGYIHYPTSGTMGLTDAGKSVAPQAEVALSNEDLQERLIALLEPVCGRLLRVIIDKHPDDLPRMELATKTGYTNVSSTGFVKAIGKLRSLGLIEYPSTGTCRASSLLFIE